MVLHATLIPIRRCLLLLCMFTVTAAVGVEPPVRQLTASTQCGWFDNSSPGNADLLDAGGSWSIAQQGGHQAQGQWPSFSANKWVRTGVGSYGYGCACLTGRFDVDSQNVLAITRSRALPLSACRSDKALKVLEPVGFVQ